MRYHEKQWNANLTKDVFGVDLHQFMEMEGNHNHMEIAEEFGITLGEVKKLKKKITRS
ncbi:hypothetical protein [Virgibacillus siamensis]|uniref:hypothetical protein n=1 Tax=Virgibacillus siamensis TaxID=480071 RepID=UPI001589AAFE|nr:hypothetical protein [Virgibacillus siamensis]